MAVTQMRSLSRISQIHGEKCWPLVDKISPCEKACPLGTDVPSYIIAISQGKFNDALRIIRNTNPLPSICGRVCHQPCEIECNRAVIDEPIAVKWLKRAAVDYAREKQIKSKKAKGTGKGKVAIIGSGPAGLTAAYDLVKKGYLVTVYEASAIPGGWLTNGIPDFILPSKIARADIQYIKDSGVDIKTNIRIGKDLTLNDLLERGYKAILLSTGAQKSARLNIPGSDLKNILPALDVLKKAKTDAAVSFRGRVLVIGGGAVAMDAARTALRLGAREAHVACLESRTDMPAWRWEVEAAEHEGVKIHTSLAPQKFDGRNGSDGTRGIIVDFKRVASTSVDPEGRISWTLAEDPSSEFSMEVDYVIVAIGQATDISYIEGSSLKISSRGALEIDDETLATNIPGIFAAGDSVNVRGTVTESMAMGRKVAESIDRYIRGVDLKSKRRTKEKEVFKVDPKLTSPWLTKKARWGMPTLAPTDATRTFNEVQLGFTEAEAVEEAKRCLNCRMCANCIYGRGQICYETAMRLLK